MPTIVLVFKYLPWWRTKRSSRLVPNIIPAQTDNKNLNLSFFTNDNPSC